MNDDMLTAYLDGELDAAARAEIDARIAADPAFAARVERQRALGALLRRAYEPVLSAEVPQRLNDAATPRVLNLDQARAVRRGGAWSVREWAAMAACLAAGLFVGAGAMAQGVRFGSDSSGLVARGALARALDVQLASEAQGSVRVGMSFRAQSGDYCRTFQASGADGLACREDGLWRIEAAARAPANTEFRMASAPLIAQAADAMIAGEPLDAEAERAARDAGWK
ncbi:MAG: anti-sigma factor [Hyphomonadaceae bacterium]